MTKKQMLALTRLQRKVSTTARMTMMFLPDTDLQYVLALWNCIRASNTNKVRALHETEQAIFDAYMERLQDSDD